MRIETTSRSSQPSPAARVAPRAGAWIETTGGTTIASVLKLRPSRCVLHGLRKAAARRLAEAGCTAHEIAALTGHTSLREIECYTRAPVGGMARSAMAKTAARANKDGVESVKPDPAEVSNPLKTLAIS